MNTMVVYGDILFLLELATDVILLGAVHRFTGRHLTVLRCLLGAAVGAAGSVVLTVLPLPWEAILPLSFALSGGMLLASFGQRGGWEAFGRTLGVLWCAGLLSGGAATFLAARLSSDPRRATAIFCTAAGVASGVSLLSLLRWQSRHRSALLSVVLGDNTAETEALCDTGNLLTEPLSGLPVVFLSEESAASLLPGQYLSELCDGDEAGIVSFPAELQRRLMPIRVTGTGGSSFVWGVRADLCTLSVGKKECPFDGYVVFRHGDGKFFGGMGAVIPASAAVL